jgi:hypothetical protein
MREGWSESFPEEVLASLRRRSEVPGIFIASTTQNEEHPMSKNLHTKIALTVIACA